MDPSDTRKGPIGYPARTTRSRKATERALIDAVGTLLAERGFEAIGVNAVAKHAGVNKTLIYRYFGGLPELVQAWADSTGFWPTVDDVVGDVAAARALPPRERWRRAFEGYVAALEARPRSVEVLAWELTSSSPITEILADRRERFGLAIIEALGDPAEIDPERLAAALSVFGAGVHQLLLVKRRGLPYNGLSLQDPRTWELVAEVAAAAIEGLLHRAPSQG